MKNCRITVVRKAEYRDLMSEYENPLEHACDVTEGQVFLSVGGAKPDGLCESAWESMRPFVEALCRGEGNFFDGPATTVSVPSASISKPWTDGARGVGRRFPLIAERVLW